MLGTSPPSLKNTKTKNQKNTLNCSSGIKLPKMKLPDFISEKYYYWGKLYNFFSKALKII